LLRIEQIPDPRWAEHPSAGGPNKEKIRTATEDVVVLVGEYIYNRLKKE
jgi:hypothetical protein